MKLIKIGEFYVNPDNIRYIYSTACKDTRIMFEDHDFIETGDSIDTILKYLEDQGVEVVRGKVSDTLPRKPRPKPLESEEDNFKKLQDDLARLKE